MDVNLLLMHGWAGVLLLVTGGLIAGSFLNVVIHRLPAMLDREWRRQAREQLEVDDGTRPPDAEADAETEADAERLNLFVPRSRCPACGYRIKSMEIIPILSWLASRGRCSNCGVAISARYPIVEALAAFAALAAVAEFGWTWPALAAAAFAFFLIALACIDLDTQLLPDQLTLPLLWAGLLVNAFGGITDLTSAVFGAAAGYLVLWSVYWVFRWITGREGMGYGDFKLFAAIGAWLGWTALPAVILCAAVIGLAFALVAIVAKRRTRHQPLPFGPFLAFAGWAALMFRETAISALPM